LSTDPEEWKPKLGDDGKRPKCSRGCHVEGLASGPLAVVLEARMDNLDVAEVELGGGCLDPIQPAALGIDQGEGRRSMGDGQREAWQPGT
jgi:hypothetical protein